VEVLVTDRVEGDGALSVSDALSLAKRALESLRLRVIGEVSEITDRAGYKAVYFTLADETAVLPCLVWRDAYARAGVSLRPGMLVEVSGGFTAYAAKGRMQFQVRAIALAGEGALRLRVAEVARRLEAEGLMRPERKRPLPAFPQRIGLVTSPRGKAVHDVIRTLRRRFPCAELLIAGVTVEGAGAVESIVDGLRVAAGSGADVVILARGGGSYEDLMPFNAEEVAREIAASRVPVVTGIGHEPDTTIADMVADVRASTPTAAAEHAAPDAAEVSGRFTAAERLLARGLTHVVRDADHRWERVARRPVLRDPRALTGAAAQALDLAAGALARAVPAAMQRHSARVDRVGEQLLGLLRRGADASRSSLAVAAARLEDLSPLTVLARGYAVCTDESGTRVVREASQIGIGQIVGVRLASGRLGCRVESITTEE
jgi:exodeoxyribonuclease VII large subunit